MSTDYMGGTPVTDHDLTLAIPGEVESVRQRLVDAVQKLGYKVIGEQPIYAKRRSQTAAASWECSLNVLDYPATLTIALKQANDVSVLATFNYEIKSYMTKGDRQTLAREAEAIVALATERLAISACRACGTQVTDESHFCRRCGAPMVFEVPELEILRLTKGARGSYYKIIISLIALLSALLTALPLFIVNGARLSWPLVGIGIPLATFGLLQLINATWQLNRTLNPKPSKLLAAQPAPFAVHPASVTTALPPARPFASVTENTTDLLPAGARRVPEPVRRKDPNTAELDSDRLM